MKVLVTGNLNGQLATALERVKEAVAKQGQFDLWLALGDVMTPCMSLEDRGRLADLLESGSVPGVKVAIFGLAATLQLGGDALAERLKAKRGPALWMASPLESLEVLGISILNVSGQERTNNLHTNKLSFTADDLETLPTHAAFVCSSEWPARITEQSETAPSPSSENGLLTKLPVKPRYWFSIGTAWEREPFAMEQTPCRFVSLASVGTVGRKWIMALQFDPKVVPVAKLTPNPFSFEAPTALNYRFAVDPALAQKRPATMEESPQKKRVPPAGYSCRRCKSTEHYFNDCPHSGLICHGCKQPGHRVTDCPERLLSTESKGKQKGECWFCLNTAACQKHLIVAVGETVYVTLAKGPISPHHLLLIPIEHQTDFRGCEAELKKLRDKITTALGKHAIWWDTCHSPHHHWHQHLLLVDHLPSANLLMAYGERVGIPLEPASSSGLRFEISTAEFSLSHEIERDAFFPVNFGRQAILECLQLDSTGDWRRSVLSPAQESQLVEQLKHTLKDL